MGKREIRNWVIVGISLFGFSIAAAKKKDATTPLYDFSAPVEEPTVAPEEEGRVLPVVFKQFLKKEEKCPAASGVGDSIERGRADFREGRFRPEIVGIAKGSFLERGREEIAYLIAVHECALEGTKFESYRLAILHDGKVLFVADPLANILFKVLDTNADGLDEILLGNQIISQGHDRTSARLVSLKGDRFKTTKDFDTVRLLTCEWSGAAEEKGELATSLFPGKRGKIVRKNYSRSCKEAKDKGRFKLISTDKPLF